VSGFRVQGSRFWVLGSKVQGSKVQGSGFWVQRFRGSGFKVQGSKVQGSGFVECRMTNVELRNSIGLK
jgi:hypothetical protein